jgi:hypothetical protein
LATLASGLDANNPRKDKVAISLAAVAGVAVLDTVCARAVRASALRKREALPDYSDRRGMPKPPDQMRGAARKDFDTPRGIRGPQALRPFTSESNSRPLSIQQLNLGLRSLFLREDPPPRKAQGSNTIAVDGDQTVEIHLFHEVRDADCCGISSVFRQAEARQPLFCDKTLIAASNGRPDRSRATHQALEYREQ